MKTLHSLYNDTIHIEFSDFGHSYVVKETGEKVPSATTILGVISKPALISWAANQATEYMKENIKPGVSYDELQLNTLFTAARKAHTQRKQETADIGSMVHKWIEDFINKENPELPINSQLRGAVENFLQWKDKHKVEFLLSEQMVYSKKYNYSGTLDFIAHIDGNLFLGDIKTSNAIYPEYWIQLAAYGEARSEEFPSEDYKHQGIIRISRDGSFEFKTAENKDACFEAFLHAKGLYEWQQMMKKIGA